MNLVLQLINGVSLVALSEGMALADRANLQTKDVLEILSLTPLASQMIKEKGAGKILFYCICQIFFTNYPN